MLAVVEINKKQYLVEKGDILEVQRIKPETCLPEDRDKIVFNQVLLLADGKKVKIGNPYLEKVKVEAQLIGEKKSKKVIVYKFNRRKKYRRKQGHRQIYTAIKITRIVSSSSPSPAK
ncbi:MAG: 50S ribosomal protein L21 [Candidatus Omnitrophota bacterium]